jgi:tetratricopeptide (TPR) repeat protein
MPCRYYIWAVVVLFASCASLFDRKTDLERGLIAYKNGQFREAANYFNAYHKDHPYSDSTLYYLFNCYSKLDEPENQMLTLEKLAGRGVNDLNIYLNLIFLYRKHAKYDRLYAVLLKSPQSLAVDMDNRVALTRRFLAELISGASRQKLKTDPMVFCISRDYLPLFPDGKTYEEDTLTIANLIVLLDRLVDPLYPRNLYPMKKVSTKSYLYLPYMRLVELGAMDFDPYLEPDHAASVLAATKALDLLVTKGYLD